MNNSFFAKRIFRRRVLTKPPPRRIQISKSNPHLRTIHSQIEPSNVSTFKQHRLQRRHGNQPLISRQRSYNFNAAFQPSNRVPPDYHHHHKSIISLRHSENKKTQPIIRRDYFHRTLSKSNLQSIRLNRHHKFNRSVNGSFIHNRLNFDAQESSRTQEVMQPVSNSPLKASVSSATIRKLSSINSELPKDISNESKPDNDMAKLSKTEHLTQKDNPILGKPFLITPIRNENINSTKEIMHRFHNLCSRDIVPLNDNSVSTRKDLTALRNDPSFVVKEQRHPRGRTSFTKSNLHPFQSTLSHNSALSRLICSNRKSYIGRRLLKSRVLTKRSSRIVQLSNPIVRPRYLHAKERYNKKLIPAQSIQDANRSTDKNESDQRIRKVHGREPFYKPQVERHLFNTDRNLITANADRRKLQTKRNNYLLIKKAHLPSQRIALSTHDDRKELKAKFHSNDNNDMNNLPLLPPPRPFSPVKESQVNMYSGVKSSHNFTDTICDTANVKYDAHNLAKYRSSSNSFKITRHASCEEDDLQRSQIKYSSKVPFLEGRNSNLSTRESNMDVSSRHSQSTTNERHRSTNVRALPQANRLNQYSRPVDSKRRLSNYQMSKARHHFNKQRAHVNVPFADTPRNLFTHRNTNSTDVQNRTRRNASFNQHGNHPNSITTGQYSTQRRTPTSSSNQWRATKPRSFLSNNRNFIRHDSAANFRSRHDGSAPAKCSKYEVRTISQHVNRFEKRH